MAYTPTTWANGDTITAAGLNKMEQGIAAAGGVVLMHIDMEDTYLADMTWQEVHDAIVAGKQVVCVYSPDEGVTAMVTAEVVLIDDGAYAAFFNGRRQGTDYDLTLYAESANSYLMLD